MESIFKTSFQAFRCDVINFQGKIPQKQLITWNILFVLIGLHYNEESYCWISMKQVFS